jgi:hypothetical protein
LCGRESSSNGSGSFASQIGGFAGFALILLSDFISVLLVDYGQVFGDGFSHNLMDSKKS